MLTGWNGLNGMDADAANADRILRADLEKRGIPYQVLYGLEQECLAQALQIIRSKLAAALPGEVPHNGDAREATLSRGMPWIWSCEKCSDPQCEHQLLGRLLADRGKGTTPAIEPSP